MSARARHYRLRSQLQSSIDRIDTIPESELQTRSEYSRYLLVRLSGFLEYCLEQIVAEYIEAQSYGSVRSFALSFSGHAGNPNADRLCAFVRRLDHAWGSELEEFLKKEERRTSLNSLVGLRNRVAHGEPSSASWTTLLDYVRVVDDFFSWLLDRLEPQR